MRRKDLPRDMNACHAMIEELLAALKEKEALATKLQQQLEQLLRHRFGQRSDRMDPEQMMLFYEELKEKLEQATEEERDEEEEGKRPRRKRKGHGRRKLPKDLERERREYDVPEDQKVCGKCGKHKQLIREETTEQLEFVPASMKVIENVQLIWACPDGCEGEVVKGQKPRQPIEKGMAGPGLLAHVVVSKYGDHLPLNRQEEIFKRHGIWIPRTTQWGWVRGTGELLKPLYELMIERVLESGKIHTDDTTADVLDRKLTKTRTGRLWVYVGDFRHPYTVYDYTVSRERTGPARFLKGYRGYLQADAYGGYDGIFASREVIEAACWAHARRKFVEAQSSDPERAFAAVAWIRLMYEVEEEARKWSRGVAGMMDPERVHMAFIEKRYSLRQEKTGELLEGFEGWLKEQRVLPKSPMAGAIGYALKNWEALRTFMKDGDLEMDNNIAEREVRPIAVGRANWTFFGSDRGGKIAAIHYSIIRSCRRHGIDPFRYLRDVIERISDHSMNRLEELLPDRWKQLREERSERQSRASPAADAEQSQSAA
jgi:transposase